MAWLLANRIKVESPADAERVIEAFRGRARKVDTQPGFLGFELWKEESGKEVVVTTRWRAKSDFEAWLNSPAFHESHHRAKGTPGEAHGSAYEVVE